MYLSFGLAHPNHDSGVEVEHERDCYDHYGHSLDYPSQFGRGIVGCSVTAYDSEHTRSASYHDQHCVDGQLEQPTKQFSKPPKTTVTIR